MIGYFVLVTVIQVLVFSGFTNGQQNGTEKVEVVVYYETLCPYAKKFIVTQLSPFLKGDLSNYINLTLIPYGKATTIQNNTNFEFTCHHGKAECYGNKLQACALALLNIGATTQKLGFNKEAVEFIVCLMKDLTPASSIAEIQKVSEKCKVHQNILNCTNGQLGSQTLAHLGNLTNHFQDPLGNVPTIVFNGVFRKIESKHAEEDFKNQFCSKIKSSNLTACQKSVGPTTTTILPIPQPSIGPTILPIPQLSLGITICAFLGINLFNSF